jgi:hypothetical protein
MALVGGARLGGLQIVSSNLISCVTSKSAGFAAFENFSGTAGCIADQQAGSDVFA